MLEILKPGMISTVQQYPRLGKAHLGIPMGGALDLHSFELANQILQNQKEHFSAIEMTLIGLSAICHEDFSFSVTGGEIEIEVDGISQPMNRQLDIKSGSKLKLGRIKNACRSYLAFKGKMAILEHGANQGILNQVYGDHFSYRLEKGSRISVLPLEGEVVNKVIRIEPLIIPESFLLDIIPGPEWDYFPNEEIKKLLATDFEVNAQSNRLGLRLKGATFSTSENNSMLSSAVFPGTIQVPQNGSPIILLNDGPTTGGYPRVAVVDKKQSSLLGQVSPGASLRFRLVNSETQ